MDAQWNKELHPNWYRDISPMRYLILGSFPPSAERRDYPFYYPNLRNHFWRLLADVAGVKLTWKKTDIDKDAAVQERYAIMQQLQAGVQNLGQEIERKGKSALDTHIKITRFQDIRSIIEAHPELQRILLPGFSAEHSTARSFLRYLRQAEIEHSTIDSVRPENAFEIYIAGRSIDCVVLNSTSTASRIKYEVLLDQFRRQLSQVAQSG